MNKINEFKYLTQWCEAYYENVGLKIHPSSVPTDVVLDDMMGKITMLISHDNVNTNWADFTNKRFDKVNEELTLVMELFEAVTKSLDEFKLRHNILLDRFIDLETRLDTILLKESAEIIKKDKKGKKDE